MRPQIYGDTIREYARNKGFINEDMDRDDTPYYVIQQVAEWWDNWVYAWDHPAKRRDVTRKLRRSQHEDRR